jgi:imidazole glycerol-phosphate synthase subunit HisH
MALRVAVIDYQMGNLFSVQHACAWAGLEPIVAADADTLLRCDGAILPGVGAFGEAMANLARQGLVEGVAQFIRTGKPFMGICLGMQLLLSESSEFGSCKGLGIIDGRVVRFPSQQADGNRLKVPQIGWNRIYAGGARRTWKETPLAHLEQQCHMYFVHSYYVVPSSPTDILSLTNYGGVEYCSGLLRDNVFATQFHPEKSGPDGVAIYSNFRQLMR